MNYTETDKQTDRQIDRQADRQRERERERGWGSFANDTGTYTIRFPRPIALFLSVLHSFTQ